MVCLKFNSGHVLAANKKEGESMSIGQLEASRDLSSLDSLAENNMNNYAP